MVCVDVDVVVVDHLCVVPFMSTQLVPLDLLHDRSSPGREESASHGISVKTGQIPLLFF